MTFSKHADEKGRQAKEQQNEEAFLRYQTAFEKTSFMTIRHGEMMHPTFTILVGNTQRKTVIDRISAVGR